MQTHKMQTRNTMETQWKLLNQLKDYLSKVSNQNVKAMFNKEFTQLLQKFQPSLYNIGLVKRFESKNNENKINKSKISNSAIDESKIDESKINESNMSASKLDKSKVYISKSNDKVDHVIPSKMFEDDVIQSNESQDNQSHVKIVTQTKTNNYISSTIVSPKNEESSYMLPNVLSGLLMKINSKENGVVKEVIPRWKAETVAISKVIRFFLVFFFLLSR